MNWNTSWGLILLSTYYVLATFGHVTVINALTSHSNPVFTYVCHPDFPHGETEAWKC